MNTTSEAWSGQGSDQSSYRPRIALHVGEFVDSFVWCLTESWSLGEYPENVKPRRRIDVSGCADSLDAAKAAAEQMAARVLKCRRSFR